MSSEGELVMRRQASKCHGRFQSQLFQPGDFSEIYCAHTGRPSLSRSAASSPPQKPSVCGCLQRLLKITTPS